MKEITYADFEKIEIQIGTVVEAVRAKNIHKPAYRLLIDFGAAGIKKSSAQITERYTAEELLGMQVTAVVNFPAKQIGKFISECLVLGALDDEGVTLLTVSKKSENGNRVA
ncbi:MAG: tRNA-binding protein [Cryomorphaceae bacterium]|nr:tRNA-binding protein [Flavobacteriales bacterium]